MSALYPFNVRVYGLFLSVHNELLISDEREYGLQFSKFPGGGLEYGEGLREGLSREYLEECGMPIEVLDHIYTTDFYERSFFNDSQIISIYYQVINKEPYTLDVKTRAFDFDGERGEPCQSFRWISLQDIKPSDLTFKTDRIALERFLMLKKH